MPIISDSAQVINIENCNLIGYSYSLRSTFTTDLLQWRHAVRLASGTMTSEARNIKCSRPSWNVGTLDRHNVTKSSETHFKNRRSAEKIPALRSFGIFFLWFWKQKSKKSDVFCRVGLDFKKARLMWLPINFSHLDRKIEMNKLTQVVPSSWLASYLYSRQSRISGIRAEFPSRKDFGPRSFHREGKRELVIGWPKVAGEGRSQTFLGRGKSDEFPPSDSQEIWNGRSAVVQRSLPTLSSCRRWRRVRPVCNPTSRNQWLELENNSERDKFE